MMLVELLPLEFPAFIASDSFLLWIYYVIIHSTDEEVRRTFQGRLQELVHDCQRGLEFKVLNFYSIANQLDKLI